jgi:hypothetical protein
MAPSGAQGYLRRMDDDYHKALVVQRSQLLRWLADVEKGELINGAPVTATPETIRHIKDEVARLTALIAKDRSDA